MLGDGQDDEENGQARQDHREQDAGGHAPR